MNAPVRVARDYESGQEVRWCPGCGDYAILRAVQKTLAELDADPSNTVFVSGIGCAARLPYYLATYGFHTIHGRAPAIATGLKLANPELDVWLVTGDGDGLSIGAGHLMHLLRRNLNCQLLLFNNEAYGLTKGQYSPTSRIGTVTPSSPAGSVGDPVSACRFALGSGARFVARGIDTRIAELQATLSAAHAFSGTAFVEILQNCIVYNDGVFADFTERSVAAERQLHVVHGEPLRFGPDLNRGLILDRDAFALRAVSVGADGVPEEEVLVHDQSNRALATLLATMEGPDLPLAVGVLFAEEGPVFEAEVRDQVEERGHLPLSDLLRRTSTWKVSP